MTKSDKKSFHTGTQKKSIIIKVSKEKTWREISNIIGLPRWVIGVKETIFLTKIKKGIGTIRKLTLDDGSEIEEHVVDWKNKESFSYIATSGLPLRGYYATISISSTGLESTKITWQSYFNSIAMTREEFSGFVQDLGMFYQNSLKNLKKILEKQNK